MHTELTPKSTLELPLECMLEFDTRMHAEMELLECTLELTLECTLN